MISIFIELLISQDFSLWRAWAQSSNVGDIYILNGVPRIQLVGNALLLVGFMIEVYRKNRITLVSAVLLFGVLATGNGAFILGIAIFFYYLYYPMLCKNIVNGNPALLINSLVALIFLILFFLYGQLLLEQKANQSNPIRIEQLKYLTDSNLLFGSGVGAFVNKIGYWRNYTGNIYF